MPTTTSRDGSPINSKLRVATKSSVIESSRGLRAVFDNDVVGRICSTGASPAKIFCVCVYLLLRRAQSRRRRPHLPAQRQPERSGRACLKFRVRGLGEFEIVHEPQASVTKTEVCGPLDTDAAQESPVLPRLTAQMHN